MSRALVSLLFVFSSSFYYGQFSEVSSSYGIFIIQEGSMWGNGASFYDFNHDGWDDLTTADGSDAVRFFINNNGVLEPASFAINFTFSGQIIGVVWLDFDNDGDEDLMASQWGGRLLLFENDGSFQFEEIGAQAGFPMTPYNHYGIACADVDKDGFLDVAVAKYYNPENQTSLLFGTRFFHNNGDGTFTDTTEEIGLVNGPLPTFQPVFFDANEDGWLDMYLVIDRYQYSNRLYLNNGDGTFYLQQQFGLNIFIDAMSCTMGDYDNDLDTDIFVSNTPPGNQLLKNNSGMFIDVATEAGVAVNQVCWGANWIDYDNDSFLDLFVGNTNLAFNAVANRWFVNNQDGTFTETPSLFGKLNDLDPTYCSVMGDVNNDGYYDYYNNNNDPRPCRFWLNDGGDNNYLSLSFEGTVSNRNAFGTKVTIYAGENSFVKHTHCGESYIAQNSSKEIFGLNDITSVDSVVITWPRGLVERYYNLPANQHIHYIEGQSFLSNFQIQASDTSLCPNQTILLDGGIGNAWLWSTGATDRFIEISEPGVYSCSVTHDFNFIQESLPLIIEERNPPVPSEVVTQVSCFDNQDGQVELSINYPEFTSITWSDGSTEWFRDSLEADHYIYTITSENGCTFLDTISIQQPEEIIASFELTNVSCSGYDDGSLQFVDVSGGTPSYTMNYNEQTLFAPGSYYLEITDANACVKSFAFEITEPEVLTLTLELVNNELSENNGTSVFASGGVLPYSLVLNGAEIEDSIFYHLEEGEYALELIDANGCQASTSFIIIAQQTTDASEEIEPVQCFHFLNSGVLHTDCATPQQPVRIYNVAGQLVHTSNTKEPINTNEWAPGIYFISHKNEISKFVINP